MTTLDELVVKIKADPSQFERELKKAGVTLSKESKKMDSSVKQLSTSFKQLGTIIAGLGIAKLGKEMISAASSMQQLEARLKATTGGLKEAKEAMQFLRGTAQRQSIDLIDLADGYNRLLPAVKNGTISMGEMRELLALTNDNIKAFGLDAAKSRELFLGLSQSLTSGTVTMEDMRQVTDKLPGVFDKMEKSLGLANGQLKKAISSGQVTAQTVMPALLKAFRENEGAAKDMADTFDSAMIRLRNSVRDAFAKASEDSGFLDEVTKRINGLSDAINEPEFQNGLKLLGNTFATLIKAAELGIITLGNFKEGAETLGGAITTLGVNALNFVGIIEDDFAKAMNEEFTEFMKTGKTSVDALSKSIKNIPTPVFKPRELEETNEKLEKAKGEIQEILGGKGSKKKKGVKDISDEMKKFNAITENVARNIHNSLADAIGDVITNLDDLENVGKRVFDNIAKVGIDAFSQIAAHKIMSSIGGSGGSFGGSAGGGGGILQLGNLFGLGGGGGSAVSSGGIPIPVAKPPVPGTFGSLLGAAGGIGGIMTGLGIGSAIGGLNLFGGTQAGSTIGGTLGGIGGTFIAGPVGAAIGSALGSAVGGLFGAKEGVKASEFAGTIGGSATFGAKKQSTEFARNLFGQLSSFTGAAELAGAGSIGGQSIRGGFNSRGGGGFLQFGNTRLTFDPDSVQDTQEAFNDLVEAMIDATAANDEIGRALRAVELDGLSAAEALRQIGIASGKLAEEFNTSLENEILRLTDARAFEIKVIKEQSAALREEAIEIGASIELVNELERLKLDALEKEKGLQGDIAARLGASSSEARRLAEQFAQISSSLKQTILDLQLGDLSALSPEEQLALSRSNFQDLQRRAALGDVEAAKALPGAARAFLQESRGFNASGAEFKSDFASVQAGLSSASSVFDRQSANQQGIVDAINNSSKVAAKGASVTSQQLQQLVGQVQRMEQSNRNVNIKLGNSASNIGRANLGQVG